MKFLLLFVTFTFFTNPTIKEKPSAPIDYVDFTLRNNSLKSIPLIIPRVMNPNLSPLSNSGVSLKPGQQILFKYSGKKRVLLEVNEALNNKVIIVNQLIKERIQALNLD